MYKPSIISLLVLTLCQCSSGQYFGGYGGGYGGSSGNGGSDSNGSPFSDGNGGFNQFENFLGFDVRKAEAIRLAHGVIACLAFVIFFPLGAIFIRLIPGRFAIVVHAIFQLFAYVLYIIGFGLGIWMASNIRFGGFNFYNNHHPIIGIVVFVFLFFQPILGIFHHIGFKKHGQRRGASYAHLWLGRILITLGIINGGLGLQLAGNVRRRTYIAYGVVAGIIWLIWVLVAILSEWRRHQNVPAVRRTKEHSSSGGSPTRNVTEREGDKGAATYA